MPSLNFAESLDHFVVPVDDIVIAEEFYVRVFSGVITKRNRARSPAHKEFVAALKHPRKAMIMVKAGAPVDAVIDGRSPV